MTPTERLTMRSIIFDMVENDRIAAIVRLKTPETNIASNIQMSVELMMGL